MVNRSLHALVALWEEDIRCAIQIEEDRDTSVQGREDDQEEGGDYLTKLHLAEEDADVIRNFLKKEVPAQRFKVFGNGEGIEGYWASQFGPGR